MSRLLITKYFPETKLSKINATSYQNIINELAKCYVKDSVKRFNSHIRASIKVAFHQGILKIRFYRNCQSFLRCRVQKRRRQLFRTRWIWTINHRLSKDNQVPVPLLPVHNWKDGFAIFGSNRHYRTYRWPRKYVFTNPQDLQGLRKEERLGTY